MAYVALSRVKEIQNLYLIAFKPQSIIVNSQCLQELNRLRQAYRPDLSQYSVPKPQKCAQKRKCTLTGSALSDPPNKCRKVNTSKKRKVEICKTELEPAKKQCTAHTVQRLCRRYRYNPVSEEWQHSMCRTLGVDFVCPNKCVPGGPDIGPILHCNWV